MAEYGGKDIVPIEDVCPDDFSHLNPIKLVQKISAGEIAIPLVRMEASQKSAKGIHRHQRRISVLIPARMSSSSARAHPRILPTRDETIAPIGSAATA
jgi:hypothetical protein